MLGRLKLARIVATCVALGLLGACAPSSGGGSSSPPSLDGLELAFAFVGVPFLQQLSSGSADPSGAWSIESGALPTGFTLSPSGALTGTPASEFDVTIGVRLESAGVAPRTRSLRFRSFTLTQPRTDPVSTGLGLPEAGAIVFGHLSPGDALSPPGGTPSLHQLTSGGKVTPVASKNGSPAFVETAQAPSTVVTFASGSVLVNGLVTILSGVTSLDQSVLSDDGSRVAVVTTAGSTQSIRLFSTATLELLRPPVELAPWPGQVAWLTGGSGVVLAGQTGTFVSSTSAELDRKTIVAPCAADAASSSGWVSIRCTTSSVIDTSVALETVNLQTGERRELLVGRSCGSRSVGCVPAPIPWAAVMSPSGDHLIVGLAQPLSSRLSILVDAELDGPSLFLLDNSTGPNPRRLTEDGFEGNFPIRASGFEFPMNWSKQTPVESPPPSPTRPLVTTPAVGELRDGEIVDRQLQALGDGPFTWKVAAAFGTPSSNQLGASIRGLTLSTDGQLTGTVASDGISFFLGESGFALVVQDRHGRQTFQTIAMRLVGSTSTGPVPSWTGAELPGGGALQFAATGYQGIRPTWQLSTSGVSTRLAPGGFALPLREAAVDPDLQFSVLANFGAGLGCGINSNMYFGPKLQSVTDSCAATAISPDGSTLVVVGNRPPVGIQPTGPGVVEFFRIADWQLIRRVELSASTLVVGSIGGKQPFVAFAPSGTEVVVSLGVNGDCFLFSCNPGIATGVRVVSVTGATDRALTSLDGCAAQAWSATGRLGLLCARAVETASAADGSERRLLDPGPVSPTVSIFHSGANLVFSPTGSHLAYSRGPGIWVTADSAAPSPQLMIAAPSSNQYPSYLDVYPVAWTSSLLPTA